MPILEPRRITSVVLKFYKVINRIYHTLKKITSWLSLK